MLSKVVLPPAEGGLGWRGCVINSRGCANVPVTSQRLYVGPHYFTAWRSRLVDHLVCTVEQNGAVTNDIRCGLAYLSHAAPTAPLFGMGFSLGANQMAKLAGEDGDACPLKTVIPICAPWDFVAGHVKISSTWLRQVYSKAMGANMRRLVLRHEKWVRPLLNWEDLNTNQAGFTLFEFDALVTSQLAVNGYKPFRTAYDFYRTAGAAGYVDGVRIPLLSISAADDPIVDSGAEPTAKAATNPNLVFASVRHGGHLGFFGSRFGFLEAFRPRRWIAQPCLEWLRAVHLADPSPRLSYATSPRRVEGRVPQIGDEMVVVVGKEEEVGFRLVGEDEFEKDEDEAAKPALTQGL